MELDQLNDDARAYYESDEGGYYEVAIPFFWNDQPKPSVPPHMHVDVVFPESFREAYSDDLSRDDADHIIEQEVSERLGSWAEDGYVCGVSGTERIDTVADLRDALAGDEITLILG